MTNNNLKEEHLRKCWEILEKSQSPTALNYTNHKFTDDIVNEVYNFIEEKKTQLQDIYEKRFEG